MTERWQSAQFCEPASGEVESGDLVVHREAGPDHLLAVVDALGHGSKAAVVATLARQYFEGLSWPSAQTSEAIVAGLDGHLRGSRGAAVMVCLVRGALLDGCGVGNVELRSAGTAVPVMLSPGVLGSMRATRLRSFSARLTPPTTLFLFTDGFSSRAPFSELGRLSPAQASATLAREHRKHHDDGAVIVAKFENILHVPGT